MAANVFGFAVILPIFLLAGLAIPVLVGIYVYRDAVRRGMNAALWVLVTLLAPALVGFVIYLLVRGSYADLLCPRCGATVTERYLVCPGCGARLKASCPACAAPVEPGWKVCPVCAAPLPAVQADVTAPARRPDRALGKVLLAVILVPLALLLLLVILSVTRLQGGVSMNTAYYTPTQYLEAKKEPAVAAWVESCDAASGQAYALCYRTERDGRKATHYLVYLPAGDEGIGIQTSRQSGVFGDTAQVDFESGGGGHGGGYWMCCVSTYGSSHAGLRVRLDGKKIDCAITEVDFNPALFEVTSQVG